MQALADGFDERVIDALPRKWLARLPHPFSAADRIAGYRYALSLLQVECALTPVLDQPRHGRLLFEQIIREHLDLGRPDQVQLIFDRRITYDEAKHVTIVDDSRNGRTQYYGNPAGLVDREVDPMGLETKYEWHPEQYRKTAEIDGLGNRIEWAYDARGNVVLERDALGQETRWAYNDLNVPVTRVDTAGGMWKREHDGRGKVVRSTNPLGEMTHFK